VLIVTFLFSGLVASLYSFKTFRIWKSKAQAVNTLSEDFKKVNFKEGEIIIKFKKSSSPLVINQEAIGSGKNLNKESVVFNDLDSNTVPKSLSELNKRWKIVSIDKVFKQLGGDNSETNDVSVIDPNRTYKISIENNSVLTAIKFLSGFSDIEYAEPNILLHASLVSDDPFYRDQSPPASERNLSPGAGGWNPLYDYQWGLKKTNIESAWSNSTGSAEIIVAVIDTGVDYNHPELLGRVINGHNYVSDSEDSMDDHGHGTHVAGIIGAAGDNLIGIAGVNWKSRILAIKGLDAGGSGSITDLAQRLLTQVGVGQGPVKL